LGQVISLGEYIISMRLTHREHGVEIWVLLVCFQKTQFGD
jgi:hypothetical protein